MSTPVRNRGWLRPRRERPCGCHAAEQRDEFAPLISSLFTSRFYQCMV